MDSSKLVINSAACSIAGEFKGANEDNVFFNGDYITKELLENDYSVKTSHPQDINVYGVFDGMGKRSRGAIASGVAAQKMSELYTLARNGEVTDIDSAMLDYINSANEAVGVVSRRTQFRCGSAFASLYIDSVTNTAIAYNLGDCKVYLCREEELFQITRDHNIISSDQSEKFADAEFDNNISQFFGIYETEGELEPFRSKKINIQKGDKFLICSDGISDNIPRGTLEELMNKNKDAFALANELCRTAESNGSTDNMSAVVVTVDTPGFHPTTTTKLIAAGIGIFLLGFIMGYFIGHMVGVSSYGKNTVSDGGDIISSEISGEISSQESESDLINSLFSDDNDNNTDTPDDDGEENNNEQSSSSKEESGSVTKLQLSKNDVTIKYYETFKLQVKFSPTGASETVKWSTSDANIVKVDSDGNVTGVGTGYAEITATGESSGKTAVCVVRVKAEGTTTTTTKKTTTTTTKTESVTSKTEANGGGNSETAGE